MNSLAKLVFLSVAIFRSACKPPIESLRIVSSPWPGCEPLFLARDLGYLKPNVTTHEIPFPQEK